MLVLLSNSRIAGSPVHGITFRPVDMSKVSRFFSLSTINSIFVFCCLFNTKYTVAIVPDPSALPVIKPAAWLTNPALFLILEVICGRKALPWIRLTESIAGSKARKKSMLDMDETFSTFIRTGNSALTLILFISCGNSIIMRAIFSPFSPFSPFLPAST